MKGYTPKDFASGWLSSYGSDLERLESIITRGHPVNANMSELYLQHSQSCYYGFEESILKSITNSTSLGCGARVLNEELTGFAYCDSFDQDRISQAFTMAAASSRYAGSQSHAIQRVIADKSHVLYAPELSTSADISALNKVFERIDKQARAKQYVERVEISFAASDQHILVLNTLGSCAADMRPLCRMQVRVVVCHNNLRESGSSGMGGRSVFTTEQIEANFQQVLEEAYDEAIINLDAQPCKAGAQTVVLGSGWPGVLLHEAVGHGLEGDFNRKETSIYSGKTGEKVTSELCTVVDNGTMANRRGSLHIDDEGNHTAENVLIEKGILRGYMQDMQNAMLMKQKITGNGRRESYAHIPMPRMTNTYLMPGEHKKEEIIASVDDGIYAVNFNGGQVDITSGNFVFNTSLAYQIKNGKVTHPVKGMSLIGNGPEVMKQVSMVGDDLALDPGIGVCGKDGQSVPVGVGQPTIKVDSIVVGGQG